MANQVDSSLPFTNDSFTNVNTTKENTPTDKKRKKVYK
jgi:hypothetical protein